MRHGCQTSKSDATKTQCPYVASKLFLLKVAQAGLDATVCVTILLSNIPFQTSVLVYTENTMRHGCQASKSDATKMQCPCSIQTISFKNICKKLSLFQSTTWENEFTDLSIRFNKEEQEFGKIF